MKNKLIDLIKDNEAQNIFNADETSLFWRAYNLIHFYS